MLMNAGIKYSLSFLLLQCCFTVSAALMVQQPDLQTVVTSSFRSDENKSRDAYRHPAQTLDFFGLQPDMHVLEIWPSRGWYTEILAPYLKDRGQLTLATFRRDDGTFKEERQVFRSRLTERLISFMQKHGDVLGSPHVVEFEPPNYMRLGAKNHYDLVLSFRNAHLWNEEGHLLEVFLAAYQALKPGGVFGMVEHRASKVSEISSVAVEGYLDESYVISVAEKAGFVLAEQSEINANSKDSKDHPKGVYTLPPTLAMGQVDRAKYLAIGESDRMTLKFIKIAPSIDERAQFSSVQ